MVRTQFGICSCVLKIAAFLTVTSEFICAGSSQQQELNQTTRQQSESHTQISPAELRHLQEAVQNSPKSYPAHMNLGVALTELDQLQRALSEFRAAQSDLMEWTHPG